MVIEVYWSLLVMLPHVNHDCHELFITLRRVDHETVIGWMGGSLPVSIYNSGLRHTRVGNAILRWRQQDPTL